MMFIYNLIPKWLLAILVVALGVACGVLLVRMEYYKIDNARLTNDNKILTDNVAALNASLDTCAKSLKAEADNCATQQKIATETQTYKQQIEQVCVKENPDAKTDIGDAIKLSNLLSNRFNGVRATKDN